MKINNEYTNLLNGAVIRVVDVQGPHEVTVITLVNSNGEETSQQRKRKMNTNTLHDTVVKDNGSPRTSGWVLISDTPAPNKAVPAAKTKEKVVTASISPGAQSWDETDLSKMSKEALIQAAHKLDLQAKEIKDNLDSLKAELKKRGVTRGTAIAGDSAMTVSVAMNFSPELAKKHLTPAQVQSFTVPTLDGPAIKAFLGEKSPEYQRLLVPGGTTIKLRMVSEADKTAAALGRLADPFKKG